MTEDAATRVGVARASAVIALLTLAVAEKRAPSSGAEAPVETLAAAVGLFGTEGPGIVALAIRAIHSGGGCTPSEMEYMLDAVVGVPVFPACEPGCTGDGCHCAFCGASGVALDGDDYCAACSDDEVWSDAGRAS